MKCLNQLSPTAEAKMLFRGVFSLPNNPMFKVPIAATCKDVCLQNISKSHSYHLKIWQIIMTSWIGNGADLKSSSQ